MSAKDRTNWFWSDWRGDPAVRRLTVAERGLWIDLLALAADGSPAGYVCDAQGRALSDEEIARFANSTAEEVSKLIVGILDKGVASRDRTGRLFNRRGVREAALAAKKGKAGASGGAATREKWRELTNYYSEKNLPLLGSVPRQTSPPLIQSKDKNLPSVQDAARAAPSTIAGTASAETQQDLRWEKVAKPVHQATRAEIEASFAKRNRQPA